MCRGARRRGIRRKQQSSQRYILHIPDTLPSGPHFHATLALRPVSDNRDFVSLSQVHPRSAEKDPRKSRHLRDDALEGPREGDSSKSMGLSCIIRAREVRTREPNSKLHARSTGSFTAHTHNTHTLGRHAVHLRDNRWSKQ